jgi:pimeloyl-ACP methyl ester carboxylesterase
MVDVGGYELHVLAEGPKDGPAIVWFGGGHSAGYSMYHLHEAIKEEARSILIDRPGTGWSDAGPFPRTTAREADEAMKALKSAGEKPPFVLAGHSFGGLLAINMARRYPERVVALALLDPTPLDVIFYGLDREGLGKLWKMSFWTGIKYLFGLYKTPSVDPKVPQAALRVLQTRSRNSFVGASIYEELTAEGLIDRAFDTLVFDGELADMPLYLIAPQGDGETQAYTETVAGGPGPRAKRFEAFLNATRERYLAASSNSTRIIAPEGTGHNFPYQVPEFVIKTMHDILKEAEKPNY